MKEPSRADLTRMLDELLQGPGRDLSGGAELEVRDQDGKVVLLAPLARHYRIDPQGIIWIRPIVGGYEADESGGGSAFDLNEARPRALDAGEVRLRASEASFTLRSGETAVLRPAGHAMLLELRRWDDFYYNSLTSREQDELDRLGIDSN